MHSAVYYYILPYSGFVPFGQTFVLFVLKSSETKIKRTEITSGWDLLTTYACRTKLKRTKSGFQQKNESLAERNKPAIRYILYIYIYPYDHQAIAHASNVSRKTWRRCSAHYVYAIAKKKRAQKSMLRHSYRYQQVFSR